MVMGKSINIIYKGKNYKSLVCLADDIGVDVSYICRLHKKYGNDLSKVNFHMRNRKEEEYKNHYYMINSNEIYTNLMDLHKKYKYPIKFLSKFIKTCPRKKKNKIWYYDLTDINTYRRKSLIKVGNVIANKEILEVLEDNKRCKVRCLACKRVYITTTDSLYVGKRRYSDTCRACGIGKNHKVMVEVNGIKYNSYTAVDKAFDLCRGTTCHYYRYHNGDMSNFYKIYSKK